MISPYSISAASTSALYFQEYQIVSPVHRSHSMNESIQIPMDTAGWVGHDIRDSPIFRLGEFSLVLELAIGHEPLC
jgi:hypothetical protein